MPHNQLELKIEGIGCENKASALKEIDAAMSRVQMGNAGILSEENEDAIHAAIAGFELKAASIAPCAS